MRVTDLINFIKARERHRIWKEDGKNPLTCRSCRNADPIISRWRFCNVRRNDDRVTKFVLNWLKQYPEEYHWFAATVARFFNNEETLTAIQDTVVPFVPERMRSFLKQRAAKGLRNFNAAYIISTNGRSMNKIDYIMDVVLIPMWAKREDLIERMAQMNSMEEIHALLTRWHGLGSFMAAQVLADIKYSTQNNWIDFHTFAASGPGSRRGLNRVMERDVNAPWREQEFRKTLRELRDKVNARLNMEPLTAQDLQNCLCEFDKYERIRLGEGRPKQRYTPRS
jgi:hypothetical protein